jgi:predicted enzyme related to lactoylglutathione lyase
MAAVRRLIGMEKELYYGSMMTNDAEKTARFLNHVFGWKVGYDPLSNEKRIPIGSGAPGFSGGVFTMENTRPLYLTIYIRVDDIAKKVRHITEHGGSIIEPPFEKSDGSRVCYFNEPSGIPLTLIQEGDR